MNFLTVTDIQNILKLSGKQAKALVRTEGFPAIRIGREYRVDEAVFQRWIQEHYNQSIKLDYSKL